MSTHQEDQDQLHQQSKVQHYAHDCDCDDDPEEVGNGFVVENAADVVADIRVCDLGAVVLLQIRSLRSMQYWLLRLYA
jgi:hypothetical protein